jgi:hypothetical protein
MGRERLHVRPHFRQHHLGHPAIDPGNCTRRSISAAKRRVCSSIFRSNSVSSSSCWASCFHSNCSRNRWCSVRCPSRASHSSQR